MSPKALRAQDVLAGIAAAVGGDHTQDLARLLRLPGTLNRKDQRNGKEPVPCELVECDPARRYAFADFVRFAETSPARVRRERVAAIRLPTTRKPSAKKRDRLNDLINVCLTAEDRSRADWALVCWAIEHGIDRDELWHQVADGGKFAERGRGYFDRTWEKAAGHTREQIYLVTERKHASRNARPSRNGTTPGASPTHCHAGGASPPPPDAPPEDGNPDEGGRDGDGDAVAAVCEAAAADPPSPGSGHTGGLGDIHLTDCGNAIRMVRDHGEDLRHCHPWRKWLAWDGSRWRLDDTAATTRYCKRTVCRMFQEAMERLQEIQAQLKGDDA